MSVIPEFDRLRCMIDLETFRERHPNYDRWVFQRGWNSALQFVLDQMRLIERDDGASDGDEWHTEEPEDGQRAPRPRPRRPAAGN